MAADLKALDEMRVKARSARRLLEPEWLMCLAFFRSEQWLEFAGDRLHRVELAPNRITVTENRIAGIIRTELAKMTKNRPVFTVTPNTGDEQDANAAEMAERIMRYEWKNLKLQELRLKALEWSRIVCAGFMKCYWDSTVGDPISVLIGPDGQILSGPDGQAIRGDQNMAQALQAAGQQVRAKQVAQGDVRVEVRSPFQMFVDPLCDTFTEAEWLIEESVKSPEYVERRYGVALKPDAPANPGLVEGRMLTGGGPANVGIRVREYWVKPCKKYPNGAKITWAQGKQLDEDDKPFDPQPYVMFTGIPIPGRFWPMSVVSLLRGPQTELNKTLSQMAENRNRIGNPTLLASRQGVQHVDEFLQQMSQTGGAYFFNDLGSPNARPMYLEAPQMPAYIVEMPDMQRKSMEDISGQHEVTNANVPPGVTAASAITLLQEADDTRLGLAMADHEEQLGRLGEKILNLVANFYTDARTIRIAGEDDAWEIFDFKGTMLRGNTHVEVQAGSAFPQSQAAKQAQLTDLLRMLAQMGHALSPKELAQYLRDTGMGASDRLVQEYTTSQSQVNRENSKLLLGIPLPINDYDDDQIHIDGHQDEQRQPRYEQQPPQIKQNFEQHVQAHQQRQQQQQQQQLEAQLQLAGQVPPQMTAAAFQDEQQLSQLQSLQQMGQQAQQGQQQAQQAGLQQANAEQNQRQAAEQHQQAMQHRDQAHQQQLQHQAEMHQARLRGALSGNRG